MHYAVIWTDGTVQTASSWELLEEAVRDSQLITDPQVFRDDMARRAAKWSGTEVETNGSSYDFLCELERASLLRTVVSPHPIATEKRLPSVVNLDSYRRGGAVDVPYFEEKEPEKCR